MGTGKKDFSPSPNGNQNSAKMAENVKNKPKFKRKIRTKQKNKHKIIKNAQKEKKRKKKMEENAKNETEKGKRNYREAVIIRKKINDFCMGGQNEKIKKRQYRISVL